MIVIVGKMGRLADALGLFAHFIGTAAEHGLVVVNPTFAAYAHYFPSTSRTLSCRFPPRGSRWPPPHSGRRLLCRATLATATALLRFSGTSWRVGLIRLRPDQQVDLGGAAFLAVVHHHRLLIVQGWHFRSSENVNRHRELIRAYFAPADHCLARSRAAVEPARQRGRFPIGVHIRRGDYRAFRGGRFYYSHAQYRALMTMTEAAFPSENVAFLVCSDEPVPAAAFSGLDILHGPGHELEDLYALALCDRLVGPPSSYSAWAAFYGAVPRYQVRDPTTPVNTASFKVAWGLPLLGRHQTGPPVD